MMTKFDFLVTDVQDKIMTTIKLLQDDNLIESDLNIRQVYDKYLHPNVLPLDDNKIWDALANNEVLNVFQFDSIEGSKAAKKLKPRTILEMSDANGLIRLMGEDPTERPIDKYFKYKQNIDLWYKEMTDFGLSKEEQKTLEPYFKQSYGVPPSQEQLMLMLMDKDICGFTLKDANSARKIVGKKQMDKIPALKEQVLTQAKSQKLGEYVWTYGAGPQMGYAFSSIHSLAYSFIGVQTLYLATNWNPIYWNTACLIVNSGSLEDNSTEEIVDIYAPEADDLASGVTFEDLPDRSGKIRKTVSTNYEKVAKAIGDIKESGIIVSLVDINHSKMGFAPDVENNQILFGLKGVLNVNDDFAKVIIENRPYISVKDFIARIKPKKNTMISLIKSGAFDSFCDRRKLMAWYIWDTCDKKSRLTMQNMSTLLKYQLVPVQNEEYKIAYSVYEFNRYLKSQCKYNTTEYLLDPRAIDFITKINYDNLLIYQNNQFYLNVKTWDKVYQKYMDIFRDWLKTNQAEILTQLNNIIFDADWKKYAGKGNISAWEMEVLCFYFHEHELAHINMDKYGLKSFSNLSEDPVVEISGFNKKGYEWKRFKLEKICGTCIAKDKTKGIVSLLTTEGVVSVKFRKEYFTLFDKQISEKNPDSTKKIVKEKSWFNRGSMIVVTGFRSGDDFIVKKYNNTPGHQLYKIDDIDNNGDIILRNERYKGEEESYD